MSQELIFLAQSLPKFVGEVWRKWSQQEHEIPLQARNECRGNGAFADCRLGAVEIVDQCHDCRDASVEVPATVQLVGDALDCLVQLALKLTCFRRKILWNRSDGRSSVLPNKAIYT